jgi:endonuclease/exonuclease/phosphatase family metal-dependent hydrolase
LAPAEIGSHCSIRLFRIDYAFVPARGAGRLIHAEVINTPLTRLASDHLPLLLEWDLAF